ncbi:helix-turn-helix transcriptional regulator [Piscibacillus sp. B03]|uniref:helix-turn-helix transcriptional regulator n=1 Tax=Piscibacillus sp. B03 TaxID=3457430 RepID=UPI003FCC8039
MALEKLKQTRTRHGMTCQDVANEVNISKEHYWMIENGKRRLSYDLAVKIARVFNKNPDDIFLQSKLTTSEQKEQEVS